MDQIRRLFEENFISKGEIGASVSIWKDGREILSLAQGWKDRHQLHPWTAQTPVLVWSATKGPAAACVLHACEQFGVSPAERLAAIWPEFGAHGKDAMSIAQVISHQAGVPVLDETVSAFEYSAVVNAIAAQQPLWPPGSDHGYHVRTYGYLCDEIVRRLSGMSIAAYWRQQFAEPMQLDFWMGIPSERLEEVSPVFPAKNAPPKGDPFYVAFTTPHSPTIRAFASPSGLSSVAAMNSPEARQTSLPASGGIGTASALGKFYAMLAMGGEMVGRKYFSPQTIKWMTTPQIQGEDRILISTTSFACGFMKDPVDTTGRKLRSIFGPSTEAFGHPGAGGSLGFADPSRRIAFAYTMNQMEPGVFPNSKALALIEALYGEFENN